MLEEYQAETRAIVKKRLPPFIVWWSRRGSENLPAKTPFQQSCNPLLPPSPTASLIPISNSARRTVCLYWKPTHWFYQRMPKGKRVHKHLLRFPLLSFIPFLPFYFLFFLFSLSLDEKYIISHHCALWVGDSFFFQKKNSINVIKFSQQLFLIFNYYSVNLTNLICRITKK